MAKRGDKIRKTSNKKNAVVGVDMEILDKYPKNVPYANPPGMMYVKARITYDDGSDPVEAINLLSVDQIERIEKSAEKGKKGK